MEELIKAVKKLKKLLKEQKKELNILEEYYLSMLLKNKSAFEPHIEELVQSPKDIEGVETTESKVASEILNENPTGL